MKKIEQRPTGARKVATVNTLPSLADQSQKNACDVNRIIARYKKTGQITHTSKKQALYADLSEVTDLIGALEQVSKAADAFDALPAQLRKKLNNDPVNLLEYLADPNNDEEAIRYGIKTRPQQPAPAPATETPKS